MNCSIAVAALMREQSIGQLADRRSSDNSPVASASRDVWGEFTPVIGADLRFFSLRSKRVPVVCRCSIETIVDWSNASGDEHRSRVVLFVSVGVVRTGRNTNQFAAIEGSLAAVRLTVSAFVVAN